MVWLLRYFDDRFNRLEQMIMSEQSQIDADAAAIEGDVGQVNTAVTAIQKEIADLKAAHPAINFAGLDTALAGLGTAVSAVVAIPPAPAPPPPPA